LTGAEKVAILLLALGKPRASQLLQRFDPGDLKQILQSAVDLPRVSAAELETLVEEFAGCFTSGVQFSGTLNEVEDLLADVLSGDQIAEFMAGEPEEPVWDLVAKLKAEQLVDYLQKQHPQTAVLVLSHIASEQAAEVIGDFEEEFRNTIIRRMLTKNRVSPAALRVVENALREDLFTTATDDPGPEANAQVADILNQLDKSLAEQTLNSLAAVQPDIVVALKRMLFAFEDIAKLEHQVLMRVFDQIPMEQVVLALIGTTPEFQQFVLSSLTARSRRVVEAELQGGSRVSPQDIEAARRAIANAVLKMIANGEIEIPSEE